jgi:hypothetical protein
LHLTIWADKWFGNQIHRWKDGANANGTHCDTHEQAPDKRPNESTCFKFHTDKLLSTINYCFGIIKPCIEIDKPPKELFLIVDFPRGANSVDSH